MRRAVSVVSSYPLTAKQLWFLMLFSRNVVKKKKIQSVKRVVFVIKVHVHLWQLITLLLLISHVKLHCIEGI